MAREFKNITPPKREEFTDHIYIFENPIITPNLALKAYSMFTTNGLSENYINVCAEFIKQEIRNHKISPERGFGFTVISKGYINVNRWWKEFSPVALSTVYVFGGNPNIHSRIIDPRKEGAYCIWEAEIYAEEGKLLANILKEIVPSKNEKEYKNIGSILESNNVPTADENRILQKAYAKINAEKKDKEQEIINSYLTTKIPNSIKRSETVII